MACIHIARLAVVCAAVTAPVRFAVAQGKAVPPNRRELVGIVRDAAGLGIRDAAVEIPGFAVRTDSVGAFRLLTLDHDTVTITVRRLGYSAVEALLRARNKQWDTLSVEMEGTAQQLSGVKVAADRNRRALEGLRTFDERRAKGNGLFITRADITDRNTLRLSDVLQTRRGIQLIRIGTNRVGVRFAASTGTRGNGCIPDLWLDGQRVRGMEIDDLVATTVQAMELYDSFALVPSEFSHSANSVPCGTIVVWTRIPGTP